MHVFLAHEVKTFRAVFGQLLVSKETVGNQLKFAMMKFLERPTMPNGNSPCNLNLDRSTIQESAFDLRSGMTWPASRSSF